MRDDDDPDGQRHGGRGGPGGVGGPGGAGSPTGAGGAGGVGGPGGMGGSFRDNLNRPEITTAERVILIVGAFCAVALFVGQQLPD